jgi:hypothetical protein
MGFASGFQAGSNAVERGLKMREEEKLKEELAKIYADPESFNDYTPEQTQQIQGLQASGAYDVSAIPANVQGQPPTLNYTPRQGLDLQGDMSGGSIQISPQPVQRYGGKTVAGQFSPEQTQGLRARAAARAVMASGDYRGAAQMFQQADDADYNAQRRPLELQGLRQNAKLTDSQINRNNRQEEADVLEEKRKKENAEWWVSQTTDADGKRRAPKPEDYLAAAQRDASSYFQTGDYTKGGQAYDTFMQRAETQILREEKERTRASQAAFDAVLKGDYKAGITFYNKFLPNGSVATDVKPGKEAGTLVVSHKDLSGNKLPDATITRQELLQNIASFGDSDKAMKYIQQSFSNNIQTQQLEISKKQLGVSQGQLAVSQANQVTNADSAASAKINQIEQLQQSKRRNEIAEAGLFKPAKDANDNLVFVNPSKLKTDKDGVVRLPKGLTPVNTRTEPTDAAVVKQATEIMNDRRNYKMVNGKSVPPTMAEATAMARANLRKQGGGDQEDPTERLIRLMNAARNGTAVDDEAY